MARSSSSPSWRIVIDASVASSASLREDLPDPTPRRCRELLEAVLRICHRLVLSPKLLEEWKAHRSRYSSTWLTRMYARRKVERPEAHPEDRDLALAVSQCAQTDHEAAVLAKDLLLVESALAADAIVVSRDDEARECFRRAAAAIGRLRTVVWVNPVTDDLLPWLEGRSKPTPAMTLGGEGKERRG